MWIFFILIVFIVEFYVGVANVLNLHKSKKKRLNICFSANLIKDGVKYSMLFCFHFSILYFFKKVKNSANHLSLFIFAIFLVPKT